MHLNTSDGAAAALASLTSLKESHMSDQPTTTPTTELATAEVAVLDEIGTDQPVVPTKAPRQSHSPAEKAAEAVSVLQRRLAKLTKSKAALELQALELEPQIEAMQKRIDYALSNPDLPAAASPEMFPGTHAALDSLVGHSNQVAETATWNGPTDAQVAAITASNA